MTGMSPDITRTLKSCDPGKVLPKSCRRFRSSKAIFARSSGLQDFNPRSNAYGTTTKLARTHKEAVQKSGSPDDLAYGRFTRGNAPGLCPGHSPDFAPDISSDLRNGRTQPIRRGGHLLSGPCGVANAMANPKQTGSKPVASCFAAYRQAVRTAERYGRMGYPMGYPMPYPYARVMTRPASDQGEPVESTFRASRRDSRVSHAPKLGLHNGYRVSSDRGPTTRPAPTGPGLGLVPQRDQGATDA